MTLREKNVSIFAGEAIDGVFFQPRVESWFAWHEAFGSLPARWRGKTIRDFIDDLGVSCRYFTDGGAVPGPVETRYDENVLTTTGAEGDRRTTTYHTPLGDLVEQRALTVDRSWRKVRFAVRTAEDLARLEWLYRHTTIHFNAEAFDRGDKYMGDRGEPQFWVAESPYETMTQSWMGFEDFMYALADVPERMAEVMAVIDRAADPLFEEIAAHGRVKIVNFGENIHVARTPPAYFEQYLLPWYEKRCGQLRRSGIFTHIHIDGDFRPLLKYFTNLPFDGLEALTPKPQGDVTLEEIREHIGGKVLLDGIPAVLFLRHHSRDELRACVEKLIEYFHPRLVLGISDELPQGGDEEALERVRWIAEFCRK